MRYLFSLWFIVFIITTIYCQDTTITGTKNIANDTSEITRYPEYSGSIKGFQKFILENFTIPTEAIKKNISGTIYIKFIVEKNGQVDSAEIIKGIDPIIDEEALRVILLADYWTPALNKNNEPVRSYFTIPIRVNNSPNKTKKRKKKH